MALTMDNSGAALVAGAPLSRKTRRVRVLRPFMLDGSRVEVDEERELSAIFAAEMVAAGKALILPDQADEAPAEAAPQKKPAKPAKESTHARQ